MFAEKEKELSPKDIARSIIFSNIFEEDVPQHFIAAKTNILIILLCFTVYSIYLLFSDYLDTILLAVLSGVAYRQVRDRFIACFQRDPKYCCKLTGRAILIIVFQAVLMVLLPWIRNQSKKALSEIDFSGVNIWQCFIFSTNPLVRISQIYLFISIAYGLFGETLHRWLTLETITDRARQVLSVLFAVFTVIVAVVLLVAVTVVLTSEVGRASRLTALSIESAYDCKFNPENGSLAIPCASKISANLSLYLPKVQNETQYLLCVESIKNAERSYLGFDIFEYEDSICAFEQQVKAISPNIIESVTLRGTGAVLVSVFGFIASLLNFFIDASFCLSTFLTVFMVSVSYFEFSTQHIYIFGESKANLVEGITNIISATIFIALEHLALGIVLFEVFRFTPFNTSLSIFLSVIAFIPLVKPSLVAMLIAPLVAWSSDHYLAPVVCCLLYAYGSSRIYDKYYSKVSLHVVIINLSVIFGIYQYGVTGIFYGPLLITLFQCVYAELFRTR